MTAGERTGSETPHTSGRAFRNTELLILAGERPAANCRGDLWRSLLILTADTVQLYISEQCLAFLSPENAF
jgi:hypothetical protein